MVEQLAFNAMDKAKLLRRNDCILNEFLHVMLCATGRRAAFFANGSGVGLDKLIGLNH